MRAVRQVPVRQRLAQRRGSAVHPHLELRRADGLVQRVVQDAVAHVPDRRRERQAREHFFQRRGKRRTLGPLQGSPDGGGGGVWFTGSWSYGVPLLEGCVTSARLVAERILQQHDLDASHIASILD